MKNWISMSFDEAVTYVEVTLYCYRGKAFELLRQAVDNLKVKSRTVNSLAWIETEMDGAGSIFFESRKVSKSAARTSLNIAWNFSSGPQPDHPHPNADQQLGTMSLRQLPIYGPTKKIP